MPGFPPAVLEHYRRPRHQGALADASVTSEGMNPLCGDRIRVALKVQAGMVAEARFTGDACAVSVAAASLLMERLHGMPVGDAERLGEGDVLALIGGEIPPARLACARLPLRVVHDGLRAWRDAAGGA